MLALEGRIAAQVPLGAATAPTAPVRFAGKPSTSLPVRATGAVRGHGWMRKQTTSAKNVAPSIRAAEMIIAVWIWPATSG